MSKTLKLSPGEVEQERLATVDEIESILSKTSNAEFEKMAKEFHAAIQSGDEIFEYCSSKDSWENGMGSAGFVIKRNGIIVKNLICKMN